MTGLSYRGERENTEKEEEEEEEKRIKRPCIPSDTTKECQSYRVITYMEPTSSSPSPNQSSQSINQQQSSSVCKAEPRKHMAKNGVNQPSLRDHPHMQHPPLMRTDSPTRGIQNGVTNCPKKHPHRMDTFTSSSPHIPRSPPFHSSS